MRKTLKIFFCFLCSLLLFSGCNRPDSNYQIDENKTEMFNDIEKIKAIKELENSGEIKTEFLKLFKEYAGFSLPEYFILPEATGQSETIADETFFVYTSIIMEKNDALEILSKIKSSDDWVGYRYFFDEPKGKLEKDKAKCSYFKKADNIKHYFPLNFIELNFHYNKDLENYTVCMVTRLDRGLPDDNDSFDKDIMA